MRAPTFYAADTFSMMAVTGRRRHAPCHDRQYDLDGITAITDVGGTLTILLLYSIYSLPIGRFSIKMKRYDKEDSAHK